MSVAKEILHSADIETKKFKCRVERGGSKTNDG